MVQFTHQPQNNKQRKPGVTRTVALAIGAVLTCGAVGLWQAASPQELVIERADTGAEDEESLPAEDSAASMEVQAANAGDAQGAQSGETSGEGGENAQGQSAQAAQSAAAGEASTIKVHVDGAVVSPGIIEISGKDLRVADAVALSGGLTENADTSAINLAAQIHDADKIHIPEQGEAAAGTLPTANAASPQQSVPVEGSAAGGGESSGGLINLNSASEKELCELPGIGEATAAKIISDREANGPFASVDDLMRVSGIGEKKLEQIKDLACV